MNRVYKLVWNRARNMYIAVSEIAKSHRKETLRSGKKSVAIFLAALFLCGTGFAANTVQAENNSPVLTDEQKNEIVDKVLEKLNNNENLSKKIQDEVFKYKNKLVFAGGIIGKQNSPSDTPMAFGNGAFANGSDGISLGYQADAFSTKAVSIGARASTLWNGDVAVGNQTHVAGLSAALGSGTELYANQSVALGTQITIVDPEVLELYKKYNYTNPDNKGAVDVPSWYWREQIIKNTPEIQDFKKRYARFLGTLDQDGLDPTYHDELYKQKLIETIMWEKTTKKFSKVTAIGFQSGVKVTGGVALGAFSNATRKSEVIGYNPNGEQYQNVADFLVKNNKKEAYLKALQEQEALEKEVSDLEKQRKSLSGEKYREISEQAYEKNKESKKASKKVNDLYNAWVSVQGAVAVGNEETGMTRQITGVAAGSEDTDAVNVAQLKALNTKVDNNRKAMEESGQNGAVKYFSVNPDNNKRTKPVKGSDNSKNDGAYGENSVAIGAFAEAADKNTLALGWSVKALGMDSLALGTMVYSYGRNSHAVGNQAAALGEESSAFGNQAKAMDMGTTALGNNAMAIQNGSTAVGYQSLSTISSTSMGTNSYALGQASLALGQLSYIGDTTFRDTYTKYNEEKGHDNNIPGYYISDLIKKNDPKIAKYKEQFKNQLQGLDGHNQEAVLRYLIIADLNKSVQFATAVGNHSTVGASQGTALGFYSTVTGAYGTALGYNSIATAYGAMAAGAYAKANTVGSVAIGFKSKVDNYGGVAIGSEATVGKNGGVALGNKSTADRGSGAVGYVLGADNSTLTKALEAPGNKARFEELKMKIKDEDVSAYNALVMTFKNAAKDSPEKEKAKQEIEKWKAAHPDFLKNVKARKAFENAWQSTYEAVSVGDVEKGITRQITGVAAGSEDTDAVNVAQLKALENKVDKGSIHYFSVNSSKPTNLDGTNWNNDGATGVDAVAIGVGAQAQGDDSTALGREAKAYGNQSRAIGKKALSIGRYSQAFGYNAVAAAEEAEEEGIAEFEYNRLSEEEKKDYALHEQAEGALYYRTKFKEYTRDEFNALSETERDILQHRKGYIYDKEKQVWMCLPGAVAIGHATKAIGTSTLAIGNSAEATRGNAIAIGGGAQAQRYYSIALGSEAQAQEDNSVALGFGAQAQGPSSIALGSEAKTQLDASVAVGFLSEATGQFSTALGYAAQAKGTASAALGYLSEAKGYDSTALGREAKALIDGSVALGEGTVAVREAGKVGYSASAGDTTFDAVLTALGKKTEYNNWIKKIDESKADYERLIQAYVNAVGDNNKAAAKAELNAWKGNHPEFVNTLEEKSKLEATWKATKAAVSVGGESVDGVRNRIIATRQITNVAAGSEDTDAVNVAQLKALEKGLVHYFSVKSTDQGAGSNWNNDGATGSGAVAIGNAAQAEGLFSTALGYKAIAQGHASTSLGVGAIAKGNSSTALGLRAQAQGESSTALGREAKALIDGSVALGERTVAGREAGTVGYSASAGGTTFDDVLTALGKKTEYNNWKNKIDESKAEYNRLTNAYFNASKNDKAAAKDKLDKWKGQHPEFVNALEKKSKLEATWRATKAAVSVGADGIDKAGNKIIESRQITNVAAGTQDTDAVNVAQLKALNTKVDKNVTDITNLKGGFTIKDTATGNVDVTLGETIKSAITFKAATEDTDGAASALTAKVDADKNVTYTLNTKKLKEEMGLTKGVGSMSSWKLKAGTTDAQAIADGDEVEFAVETADKGLTVKRDGKKIQYGINADKLVENINSATTKITNVDGDNIDLSKNTSIKTINENITKLAGKVTKVTVNGKDDNSDDANANLKIKKTEKDGQLTYDLSLNDEITIGKDGKDGKIGLNGKDGHSAEIIVGKGEDGVDGTNGKDGITRIIYKDQGNQTHEVATLDDGLKFKGDNDSVVIRKLNSQMDIKGGAAAADLSDNNIGVVGTADADGQVGNLTVKLSKKLTGLTSAEFKDGDNITNITGGNISITKTVEGNKTTKNIDLWDLSTTFNNFKGGFTIKDAASGTVDVALGETTKSTITFKAETKNDEGATSAFTATVDTNKNVTYKLNTKKLKEEMGLTKGVGSMSSWNLKATGDTKSEAIADGNIVEFAVAEADKGLTVKRAGKKIQYGINADKLVENINTATTKITNVDGDNIDLSKNTSIKTINENITKMAGKATKVTVDDKDDNSDDADASLKITSKTVDGQTTYNLSLNDKITIGKDGKDGKIGLNGKDGKSAEITVGKGKDGVDGKNGENGITRIIYTDKNSKTHEVATLDDGLKFKGDNDSVVIRKLNSQMDIKGGAAAADLSDNNIGVVGTADADGQVGNLTVKLSKKLTGLTSAQFVDGDKITNITGGNISVTKKVDGNTTTKNIDLWDLSTTVEGNTTNISNLTKTANNFKGGFTIKDAVSGTVDVALGETTKPTITFKAETKDTDEATSALTATVDTNKNVTYTLNTKKLKEEMGLNNLGTGTMSSWKLKVGTESTDVSNGNEVTFAASTDKDAKGLSIKKEGNVITYGINKSEFVGNIAGDIITEINKTTNTTKITNVDWSKFPGMNFYTQGSVNNGVYTPGASADNKWSSSHIVFGDGIKVEKLKDKDNNQVTRISLDGTGGTGKNGKGGKSAYEIWRDHEENGNQPNKDKTEKQFLESLKGKDGKDGEKGKDGVNGTKGTDGKDGTNGKSAYEIWKSKSGNENKTEDEFLASLKGKDGANGKDGKDGTIADIQGDDKSGVSVTSTTEASKKTYTIGLGTKITAGEVTIDGTKDKENAVVGDVKINGEKGKGTITGLSNKIWDVNKIVSGRAATEDQLQQAAQNMQNHIYEIGKHMNGIAASNAALAGLHPLEYDEDDKWNLSAAIGNYKGANAVALGAFYRPNERTLLSVGGTLAGEEHLLNVGLSLKTGPGTNGKVYASRAAMVREIQKLKEKEAVKDQIMQNLIKAQKEKEEEIKALQEKDAQREKQIRQLMEMVMELKK